MASLWESLTQSATHPSFAAGPEMTSRQPSLSDLARSVMGNDLYRRTGETADLLATATLPFAGAAGFGLPQLSRALMPTAARGTAQFDNVMAGVLNRTYPSEVSAQRGALMTKNDRGMAVGRTYEPGQEPWGEIEAALPPRPLKAHELLKMKAPPANYMGDINDREPIGPGSAKYLSELLAQQSRRSFAPVR